ncbi:hypothetical protein B0H11DRAFT_2321631 [Mycena galericulata]|nr:hypothetical protein B0H11DRAFT_2321631 [Mycena galericulata]
MPFQMYSGSYISKNPHLFLDNASIDVVALRRFLEKRGHGDSAHDVIVISSSSPGPSEPLNHIKREFNASNTLLVGLGVKTELLYRRRCLLARALSEKMIGTSLSCPTRIQNPNHQLSSDRRSNVERIEILTEIPTFWPVPLKPTAYIVDLSHSKWNKLLEEFTVDALIKNKDNDSWTGNSGMGDSKPMVWR